MNAEVVVLLVVVAFFSVALGKLWDKVPIASWQKWAVVAFLFLVVILMYRNVI